MYVGFEFPWAAEARFFGVNSSLLGTIAINGNGRDSQFAGWQADSGLIGGIQIVDMTNNARSMRLDDFIREVPEPGHLVSMIGMLTVLRSTRYRSRHLRHG
jgi:hypothetical protein